MSWFLSCIGCGNKYLPERNEERELDFEHCSLVAVPFEVFDSERFLEELYLDSNQITELSPSLFHCHELRILSFSDNDVHIIPAAISSLSNLITLNFSKNGIADIPDNIKNCKKIENLNASTNPLCKLPESLTQLAALKELCLNDTFLEYLPANFGRLSGLEVLELRENQLNLLPLSMARLGALKRIDLGQNYFSDLPEVIGHLTSLTDLWIDNNKIASIPSVIGNLFNLLFLDASKNQVKDISPLIGNCKRLTSLYLNYNCIKSLPEEICNCLNLKLIHIDDNYIGFLPDNIGHLEHLREFNLCNNMLFSFPLSCGLLRNLRILHLDNNKLESIPSDIGSCGKLVILTASYNQCSILPAELGNLSKLRVINICRNKIESLPVSFTKLELTALWLSENQTKPLVPLHSIVNPDTGHKVLTCYILPQVPYKEEPLISIPHEEPLLDSIIEARRARSSIHFASDKLQDQPGSLSRTPTPYPKELRALARHTRNQALKKYSTLEKVSNYLVEPGSNGQRVPVRRSSKDSFSTKICNSDAALTPVPDSISVQQSKVIKNSDRPASIAVPEPVVPESGIKAYHTPDSRAKRPKSLAAYFNDSVNFHCHESCAFSQSCMNVRSPLIDRTNSSDSVPFKTNGSILKDNNLQSSSLISSNRDGHPISLNLTDSSLLCSFSRESSHLHCSNTKSNSMRHSKDDHLPDSELVSIINQVSECLNECPNTTIASTLGNGISSDILTNRHHTHSSDGNNEKEVLPFSIGRLSNPCVKVGQLTSPSKIKLQHLSTDFTCSSDIPSSFIQTKPKPLQLAFNYNVEQDSAPIPEFTDAAPIPEFTDAAPIPELMDAIPIPELMAAALTPGFMDAAFIPEFTDAISIPESTDAAPIPEFPMAASISGFKPKENNVLDSSNNISKNDYLSSRIPQLKSPVISSPFNSTATPKSPDKSSHFVRRDLKELQQHPLPFNQVVESKHILTSSFSKIPRIVGSDDGQQIMPSHVMKDKEQLAKKSNIPKIPSSNSRKIPHLGHNSMQSHSLIFQTQTASKVKELLPSYRKSKSLTPGKELLPMQKPINTTGIPLPSASATSRLESSTSPSIKGMKTSLPVYISKYSNSKIVPVDESSIDSSKKSNAWLDPS